MREALYEICAIYRRWFESARRRPNDVRVKRPLIRLRHPSTRFARSGQALLPQLKSAGGEGLSIGGPAENERLAQLHIVQVSPPTGCRQFHSACEKCGLTARASRLASRPRLASSRMPSIKRGRDASAPVAALARAVEHLANLLREVALRQAAVPLVQV